MTTTIKAFGSYGELYQNPDDVVNRLGELSPQSRTFSRNLREYSEKVFPSFGLHVFSTRDDTGKEILPLDNYTTRLLEIVAFCYERATTTNNTATSQDFMVAVANRFDGIITGASTGPMVAVPGYRMPANLRFDMTTDGQPTVHVELWFADNEFQTDYDTFEMEVIHPVSNLNVLIQPYAAVLEATKARPIDTMNLLMDDARKNVPYTRLVFHTVRWYSPADDKTLDITFLVALWGPRGNTADNINAFIRNRLLNGSTISETNWKLVLPDLFRVTRFFVAPGWNFKAIPDGVDAGMYSPLLALSNASKLMFASFPETNDVDNVERLEFAMHPFRSIGLVFLAGLDNRQSAQTLAQVIPDYIGQESGGLDYNRQGDTTRLWITQMGIAIRLAESYAISTTAVPLGMDIVSQGNKRCVRVKISGVEYLILCRVDRVEVS